MSLYGQILLWGHVIGATVLLGTGAGIAFFMLLAHRTGDAKLVAHVAGSVVVADTVFTATAAIVQPITGYLLAREVGWAMNTGWIEASLTLYVAIGACWLPVVAIQIRMRDLARMAAHAGTGLPTAYGRLYRIWFSLGFPAFAAVLAIVWLMANKPDIPAIW